MPLERPAYDLARPEVPDLAGVQIVIHCAHAREQNVNRPGAERLFHAARRAGVRSIVFLSSLASDREAHSRYGREKSEIESLLDPRRDVILRPGLVVGDGGLFAAMTDSIRRFHVAPIVERGLQPVYTIEVSDLVGAAVDIVTAGGAGLYLLAAPQPRPLRELYYEIARRAQTRVLLVPVPYSMLVSALSRAERWGLPLPISAETLRGVRNLRTFEIPRYREVTRELR